MTLKLRKRSLFPASVSAVSPLILTKAGVVYTFSIDIDQITASLDPLYLNKHLVVYTVVSSTASANDKARADYVCDGVNDQNAVASALLAAGTTNSKVVILPGVYTFSAALTISNANDFVLDAGGSIIFGPASSADTIIIDGSATGSQFNFGTILTNGSGAAIHVKGAAAAVTNTFIRWGLLQGTSHQGKGLFLDATTGPMSVNHCSGGWISGFDKGVVMDASGTANFIDTTHVKAMFIYDNNTNIYGRSGTGTKNNSNQWEVNVDSYIDNSVSIDLDHSYDVFNVIWGSQAPTQSTVKLLWLRAGALGNIFNGTPDLYQTFVGANYVQDDSGNTSNSLNVQASLDAVNNGGGQLALFSGSTKGQLQRTGLSLGTVGAINTVAQFTALGVLSSSATLPAGTKLPGTTTNDNASAGNVGEIITAGIGNLFAAPTATITVTIASPGVVTWTAHGIAGVAPVVFTTTGALPTGITAGTVYWTIPSTITTNTFQIATSVANALAGTPVNTSGSQSGTQTGTVGVPLTTGTPTNGCAVSLTAGDWDISGTGFFQGAGTTTLNYLVSGESTTTGTFTGSAGSGGSAQTYAGATPFATLSVLPQQFGPQRVSLASTTTIYGIVQGGFGVSTLLGFAFLRARRVR